MTHPSPYKASMHRIPVSLQSGYSLVGAMAAGLYWAIEEHGLALPSQREIAAKCRYSPATLSRRLRQRSLVQLVSLICDARARTYPWTNAPAWPDWLPRQRELLTTCLSATHLSAPEADVVDAVHALVEGLTRRMLVDPDFSHARATSVLRAAIGAWTTDT